MWFIFPQIAGLGRSAMAQAYADPHQAIFRQVIDQYFGGPDPETERRI
jgi:uncharacterized protein (DUF1810 family)